MKTANLLNFESWIGLLNQKSLPPQDQALFMHGIQEHPEWVNQSDEIKQTPLMRASTYGNIEAVQALIQLGAHFNAQNHYQWTALILAAQYNHVEVVQALIQAGSDLNLQNKYGMTALISASQLGNLKVVQALTRSKAELDLQDQNGWTALMHAVDQDKLEVVQTLIQQGADPLIFNKSHQTALDLVGKRGQDRMTLCLKPYEDACLSQKTLTKVLSSLVEQGPSIETKESENDISSKKLRL